MPTSLANIMKCHLFGCKNLRHENDGDGDDQWRMNLYRTLIYYPDIDNCNGVTTSLISFKTKRTLTLSRTRIDEPQLNHYYIEPF